MLKAKNMNIIIFFSKHHPICFIPRSSCVLQLAFLLYLKNEKYEKEKCLLFCSANIDLNTLAVFGNECVFYYVHYTVLL